MRTCLWVMAAVLCVASAASADSIHANQADLSLHANSRSALLPHSSFDESLAELNARNAGHAGAAHSFGLPPNSNFRLVGQPFGGKGISKLVIIVPDFASMKIASKITSQPVPTPEPLSAELVLMGFALFGGLGAFRKARA